MTKKRDDLEEINHGWAGRALATGRIAGSAMRLASRRLLGRDEARVDGAIGEHLAAELDRMKGLAMKVGQILSYFEGSLPPATHEALRKLQRGAQPVAFASLVPVVEEAFGRPIAELFDSIDPVAVAAASIGQVHRATFEGAPVAVKIQYPNVRKTFEADFARVGAIAKLASLATEVDGPAIAAELRERVLEECDYLREAEHQARFARDYARDPAVHIPEVIRARCAATVLTTRWCDGLDFYSFAEHATPAQRSAAGLVLARFAHHSFFVLAALNADPHPGNYLFEGDRTVFLDFGCVRRFDREYVEGQRHLARVVLDGERARFDDAVMRTGIVPHPDRFDFDAYWRLVRHQYEPYLSPRYRFTFDYVKALAQIKRDNPNLRQLAIPPEWIWQTRVVWGLHAVLARLDAEGAYRDVLRRELDSPLAGLDASPA